MSGDVIQIILFTSGALWNCLAVHLSSLARPLYAKGANKVLNVALFL